ncbi:MAG: magnesium/cobalt transporter CorA [Verrucomicrobiae bacterium]|nr:magnesium/cobalt transporter CorA [Verrucomicrobiae bacterium]
MIRSFVFNQGKLVGQDLDLDSLRLVLFDKGLHVWVDLEASSDEEAKSILDGVFGFHPLAIEDCITPSERPKVDEYDNYLFLVIHAVDYTRGSEEFRTTELNIFFGKDFVVTYHREPLRSVTATIDRVLKNAPAVARAPDRLTHTMLDFLFENYRPVMEELSAEISELETRVLQAKADNLQTTVLKVKQEVAILRSIIAPQRDVIARLARGEFKFVRPHLLPYYRDLLDQLVRISDQAESYRDSLTNLLLVQLNLQQAQTNEVIKVLTVFTVVTLPAIMIASWYGMNLKMPEFDWDWGYPTVIAATLISTILIGLYFRSRKWF